MFFSVKENCEEIKAQDLLIEYLALLEPVDAAVWDPTLSFFICTADLYTKIVLVQTRSSWRGNEKYEIILK